ncbi:hypothetical protein LX32DRAFT_702895 [Colletotrichum zoysiae]|uniref:2EXR domain-containing protein n=1 Tax=Colletotrichum zoysiae TaxID=1216348 RepID=A0AAD9HBC2_9PEZI|nr:hypothetical protein LX32DRAFT_702895 [Colletotrichum zoysiae]
MPRNKTLVEIISRLEAKIKVLEEANDENPNSDNQNSPKTFPQFRQFPIEIRRAVWEASLPTPRVFEPKVYDGDNTEEPKSYNLGKPTRFYREWAPPKMRGACREAYAVCMSLGRFTFGWFKNSSIRSLWFNDKYDAVYFSHYRQWDCTRVRGVQTVYVGIDIALTELTREGFKHDNLSACRRLVVALDPEMLALNEYIPLDGPPGTKPVFRAMKDHDLIGPHQLATDFPEVAGKEFLTWGDLRSILEKTRTRVMDANTENRVLYKGHIQMEAVEVFRVEDDGDGLM